MVSAAWSSSSNVVLVGTGLPGTGVILYSFNSGFKFTAVSGLYPEFTDIATVTLASKVYYLAVTKVGNVYLSTTLGRNWTQPNGGTLLPSQLLGITIGLNGIAYVAGYSASTGCYIASSSISTLFATWSANLYTTTNTNQLNNIRTFDGKHIIAIGNAGVILVSNDSGQTWNIPNSVTGTITSDLYSISGVNSSVVVIGGSMSTLYITKDRGLNWKQLLSSPNPSISFIYNSITMLSHAVIYVAGSNGYIQSTDNGGRSWKNEINFAGQSLYCLAMYSSAVGVSADGNGNAYVKFQAISYRPSYVPSVSKSPAFSYSPSISMAPQTLAPINNSTKNDSYYGGLSKSTIIAISVSIGGVAILLILIYLYYKCCRSSGDYGDSEDSSGCCSKMCYGVYFMSCCCCIYLYRYCCQRSHDDDDDDDDDDEKNRKPTLAELRKRKLEKQKEEEEEEEDDDDDKGKKKGGWFSMFSRNKNDDDDDDEEEDEEEEKPKKVVKKYNKKKNDDDDD